MAHFVVLALHFWQYAKFPIGLIVFGGTGADCNMGLRHFVHTVSIVVPVYRVMVRELHRLGSHRFDGKYLGLGTDCLRGRVFTNVSRGTIQSEPHQ